MITKATLIGGEIAGIFVKVDILPDPYFEINIEIQHCNRESNLVTDVIAKHGINCKDLILLTFSFYVF